jgi:RNA polymerase sigma-70 factor (ECF subfamily)
MTDELTQTSDLVNRAADGDKQALNLLFDRFRDRLKRMVRLRLNPRLRSRLDESDVLQEAFLEMSKRLDEYLREPQIPFFIWLRHMTGLKLTELHRHHLGTQLRDAGRELSLHPGAMPAASSIALAEQLLGKLTSPTQAAVKAEMRIRLQEALNSMGEIDREILALRHFEQLTNKEAAEILGLSASTTSERHLNAIKRLRRILQQSPGFSET